MTDKPDQADQSNLPTDEELIAACRGGDRDAIGLIIDRYQNEVYRFLYRFLGDASKVDDVFQETFAQVYFKAEQFNPEKRFKPWLFTIAANKARDYLRKAKRGKKLQLSHQIGGNDDLQLLDLLQDDMPSADDILEQDELRQRVRDAVNHLQEHQREILILAYFHQLAYNEIAESLDLPLGTVKSRLHSAVKNFAKHWKSLNSDQEIS